MRIPKVLLIRKDETKALDCPITQEAFTVEEIRALNLRFVIKVGRNEIYE